MTLHFERLSPAIDTAPPPGLHLLGQRTLQAGGACGTLPALLQPGGGCIERCLSGAPAAREGRTGLVAHRFDGTWLYGEAQFPLPSDGMTLQAASRQLYRDLFQVLREHGGLQPLKIWNYLPRINAELDGLEVYRHFNIGRQQAFFEAGASAFEGAPAACALGHHGEHLSLSLLAGPVAPRPVENPRQVSAYRYPSEYGPSSPSFSRAALAETAPGVETLFISGTASIVGHATVHAGDVVRQTEETLRNLHAVLDAAHALTSARFELGRMDFTIYLRHPADQPQVQAVLAQALGAASPALRGALWLHADVCRSDLLMEIEAQGSAPR